MFFRQHALSAILGEDLTTPEPDGGYPWSCGGEGAIKGYLSQPAVMKALHIANPGQSTFHYHSSGPVAVCIKIDEFCIENDEFCIYNDDFNTNV